MLKRTLRYLFDHRKILFLFFLSWGVWSFGLGTLWGWFFSKGSLGKLPSLSKGDRILVLAPHIDDEVISSAGLIQEASDKGAKVKIVYFTNGDNNLGSVVKEDKNIKVDPNSFVVLGEKRMKEGKKALEILNLKEKDLLFLGYPDRGLYPMSGKFYHPSNPYSSQGTKFSYNPYSGTYKSQQSYTGSNVALDLQEIINDFNPTLIIVSHPRDSHPDHRAVYLFLEKVFSEKENKARVFAYLVHYPNFPAKKGLYPNEFLYPPTRLFTQKGWYSFDLSIGQRIKKLESVNQNASQKEFKASQNFLRSFVKDNEIFEEIN